MKTTTISLLSTSLLVLLLIAGCSTAKKDAPETRDVSADVSNNDIAPVPPSRNVYVQDTPADLGASSTGRAL